MNCAIADDEYLARELIASYVQKVPNWTIEGKYSNPLEILPALTAGRIDVLFLDIQMPEITGLDFIKTLPKKPAIILTTAYSEYALEAFNLDVVDYLVKPIAFSRFLQAIQKVKPLAEPISPSVQSPGPNPEPKTFILIRTQQRTVKIELNTLLMVEGQKEYVCYYTTTGQFLVLDALKNIENNLPADVFLRVHKSYIVSLKAIQALEGNELSITGGFRVPIGPMYKDNFLQRFQ